jgi:hypothetical protein
VEQPTVGVVVPTRCAPSTIRGLTPLARWQDQLNSVTRVLHQLELVLELFSPQSSLGEGDCLVAQDAGSTPRVDVRLPFQRFSVASLIPSSWTSSLDRFTVEHPFAGPLTQLEGECLARILQ